MAEDRARAGRSKDARVTQGGRNRCADPIGQRGRCCNDEHSRAPALAELSRSRNRLLSAHRNFPNSSSGRDQERNTRTPSRLGDRSGAHFRRRQAASLQILVGSSTLVSGMVRRGTRRRTRSLRPRSLALLRSRKIESSWKRCSTMPTNRDSPTASRNRRNLRAHHSWRIKTQTNDWSDGVIGQEHYLDTL